MDDARFDEMARGLDARLTRRHAGGLATGALLALGLAVDTDAKKKKEKTFCLNGQTTVVKGAKKKIKKLRKQGAAPGACSPPPPPPTCTWTNPATFGASDLGNPHGVAMTPDGLTVLVSIINNHHISVWTRTSATGTDWSNQTTFGSTGSGDDNFNAPHDVAITLDGLAALVADTNNDRMSDWMRPNATSPAWTNQTAFGTSDSDHLDFPRGVAVTPDGQTAVVSDAGNDRMSVWALTCTT